MSDASVRLWREPLVLPTYEPFPPQKNPMFLDRRVYQGSSGKVYPLPVIDRIAEKKTDRSWDAVHLENEFLRLTILPEIGGRIHVAQDKTNGYDFIYRQDVIKPALVGLAGPWISGGIEFNWPQHHRPSTFMRCDVHLEEHADGSKTVWLSEHDPMLRMKGMHGVCLHPGRAVIELKVRAYNRTPFVQTFLWWANVAVRVHEAYRSFFPPDVHYVADHAKRSMSAYPLCAGRYYGVDYAARARHGVPAEEQPRKYAPTGDSAPNDLSWYANIPVPTSYMCMGTREDFFGGYDFKHCAGVIHVADHRIAPGKKQWTWGNHEFGYAWDRNLTDADANGEHAPYIELMAGVYTDNQPDFSFLQPGETKTWSQFWYPIREIGPAQQANVEAALSFAVQDRAVRIGVAVTRPQRGATLRLSTSRRTLREIACDLAPGRPRIETFELPRGGRETELRVALIAADGRELVAYQPQPRANREVPPPATEPPAPEQIASADELYLAGVHLEQYRHATRAPELYWREALHRDPGDARCNHALGRWHLRRGEFVLAERHLRAAVARLTARNPNPPDGEPHYTLGLALRWLGRDAEAYDAFAKAAWDQAWQSAAHHALAEIDCARGDWQSALAHLDHALATNVENLRARDLKAIVLRRLGRAAEAAALLDATLALDPLDWWARHLRREPLGCDTQTRLDLAHDFVRAGLHTEALSLLAAIAQPEAGTAPLIGYTAAWICHAMGDARGERDWRKHARAASPDFCFPARLEELRILAWAIDRDPRDARAAFYLGNLLYDRSRRADALACWEKSARLAPDYSVVWRNLGLGTFNVRHQPAKARRAYDRAFRADPTDARLLYERDQLWQRLGAGTSVRLRELERHPQLVAARDDLALEFGYLLLQSGRADEALALVTTRKFQPWEGGEGRARGLFERTHVALGRRALAAGDAATARKHFEQAIALPENLGEARHLLANAADLYFWLGCAHAALGDKTAARSAWRQAAGAIGDFQEMRVTAFSEQTYFAARALEKLGRRAAARALWRKMLAYARGLARQPATIDYFATSLPTMILFEDDLRARQATHAQFLQALAQLGLGEMKAAREKLRGVLRRDPSHAGAAEQLGDANSAAGNADPGFISRRRRRART
ncbi:MAG TPA: DUF5107 domain-containing protein [Opitutaceae bacterium]|nr:DUF5107 domain-containing protein [Opitutaceae bacterium]